MNSELSLGKNSMPYEIKQDGDDYIVVNKDSGKEKARHTPPDAKEKAVKQVHLLNAVEHGWEPTHND
jgi:hypothetical protein